MKLSKQTIIVVVASTAIGYFGDILSYSISRSHGQKFKIYFPTGAEAWKIRFAGVAAGFLFAYIIQKIQRMSMSEEEKALSDLYDKEVALIQSGVRKGIMPAAIQWTQPA